MNGCRLRGKGMRISGWAREEGRFGRRSEGGSMIYVELSRPNKSLGCRQEEGNMIGR